MVDQTSISLTGLSSQMVAVGALGTAAFGLADASKALWGGPSRVGFGYIVSALQPFASALRNAVGQSQTDSDWKRVLRSHWINGRDANDQKAIATAMIQLGLTPGSAKEIALTVHVNADAFVATITALTQGKELSPEQVNIVGRFKASVETVIDAAYARADQAYRNAMRALSGAISVALALTANALVGDYPPTIAVLVGLVAVPLAPIAKDIASALQSAASAFGSKK